MGGGMMNATDNEPERKKHQVLARIKEFFLTVWYFVFVVACLFGGYYVFGAIEDFVKGVD